MIATMQRRLVVLTTFMLLALNSFAATEYVTDRVILGVHQDADENSPLIKSIPSGTAVEVLDKDKGFKQIRLPDGREGWISSVYLVKQKPSTAQYDDLLVKHKKALKQVEQVQQQLKKNDRELQVRRDELSNAKTTIRELKRKLKGNKSGATSPVVDEETQQKLTAAEQTITELKLKIAEMEKSNAKPKLPPDQQALLKSIEEIEKQKSALQGRIEMALANLSGQKVPTPEELAGIRPSFPSWYWGLLVAMILLGAITGIVWMDIRSRKRHGGFRV